MQQQQDDRRGQVKELGEHFGVAEVGRWEFEEVVDGNEGAESDSRVDG